MKTKQPNMIAVVKGAQDNGHNYGDKEMIKTWKLIDPKTERAIVDLRIYSGRSRNSSTIYASFWLVAPATAKRAEIYAAGSGTAGGWGYDKASSAAEDAIRDAGIELYGSPYMRSSDAVIDKKRRAHIGGVGDTAVESALLAIGYAAGYSNLIMVRC